MTWKCYLGQPIEFKAKYEGVLVKFDGGPDTSPVYGLKVANFAFLKPDKIYIGKGFYVQPDLPHGITHYGPDVAYDLELIVTGPGLPAAGQRVTFQWGLSPCYAVTGAVNTICKMFMGMKVLKSKSGASTFTIEFISGYSEQQFIKGWNQATWRICYDGPFEMVMMAPLPTKWEITRIPLWIDLLKSKIAECESAESCELNVQTPVDVINGIQGELLDLLVPDDLRRLRYEIASSLEMDKAELKEADELLSRSEVAVTDEERQELRATAISHLDKASELTDRTIQLLSELQRSLM